MEVCCTVLWCNKGLQHSEAVDLHLGMGTQLGQPGGGCQLGFPHASQEIEVHYLHGEAQKCALLVCMLSIVAVHMQLV